MIASRLPLPLIAALLALCAVLGVSVLTGWHAASFDDIAPAHEAVSMRGHDHVGPSDPDEAVHLAAHAVVQGIAIPNETKANFLTFSSVLIWVTAVGLGRLFERPRSLLRPPRT